MRSSVVNLDNAEGNVSKRGPQLMWPRIAKLSETLEELLQSTLMLPDFVKVKRELSENRSADLSSNLFDDPVLSKIRRYRQHEGDRFTICREDGTQANHPQKLVQSELITFDPKVIQSRGEQAIYESIVKARSELSMKSRRMVSQRLEEEPVPSIDAEGRPFTAELFLEALDRMELQFDQNGLWKEPDFWQEVPNPRMKLHFEKERQRFDSEPELKGELERLLVRKRKEFDDREANRKLVD